MDFEFLKEVRHKLTGQPLWLLKRGNEQILCRTKDLQEVWFYPEELEEVVNGVVTNTRFI